MALTKSFKDRVQTRAETDPAFRYGLLTESIEAMLSGDIETGKSLLRDYVCLLYTSPSPRDRQKSRMPSSA